MITLGSSDYGGIESIGTDAAGGVAYIFRPANVDEPAAERLPLRRYPARYQRCINTVTRHRLSRPQQHGFVWGDYDTGQPFYRVMHRACGSPRRSACQTVTMNACSIFANPGQLATAGFDGDGFIYFATAQIGSGHWRMLALL